MNNSRSNKLNPPQIPYELNSIRNAFSKSRMNRYIDAVYSRELNEDEILKNAFRLYHINLVYCEALYPSLHTLEIALRNSIDSSIVKKYHEKYWFIPNENSLINSRKRLEIKNKNTNTNENPKIPKIPKIILPKNNKYLLIGHEEDTVINAIIQVIQKIIRWESNSELSLQNYREKILAELNFGFWTSLLPDTKKANNYYLNKIFIPCIKDIFPYAKDDELDHSKVSPKLINIRKLRNRVFHYEPIWDDDKLKQTHDNIHQFLRGINPNTSHWLLSSNKIDRFSTVYDQHREEMIDLTQKQNKHKILTPINKPRVSPKNPP